MTQRYTGAVENSGDCSLFPWWQLVTMLSALPSQRSQHLPICTIIDEDYCMEFYCPIHLDDRHHSLVSILLWTQWNTKHPIFLAFSHDFPMSFLWFPLFFTTLPLRLKQILASWVALCVTSLWRMAASKVAPKGPVSVVDSEDLGNDGDDGTVVTVAGMPLTFAKPLILSLVTWFGMIFGFWGWFVQFETWEPSWAIKKNGQPGGGLAICVLGKPVNCSDMVPSLIDIWSYRSNDSSEGQLVIVATA